VLLDSTFEEKLEEIARQGDTAEGVPIWRRSLRLRLSPQPSEDLPPLRIASPSDPAGADLVVQETLGEGGMGIVQLALQRSLRREVAIKRLKPGDPNAELANALLREAHVGGSLEHPSIVPIYALGADADGQPVLVMKRVEGLSWRQLLAAPTPEFLAGREALERNIDVLIHVANAVDYAHSRGIIHRDLKPDNVMIGAFGEVYVLDWGVALRVGPKGGESPGPVVGTPAYMAPEMLNPCGSVSARTDVYLLGAILHEIVTGETPHTGADLRSVLQSVRFSEPFAYGAGVAPELAAICWRAMDRDPSQRFPSARAFRDALTEFLVHRSSLAVAERATERMRVLFSLLQQSPPASVELIYRAFAECRFGFQQALQAWSGNGTARANLDRCLEAMLRFELDHRRAAAAAALLPELSGPAPELATKVAALDAELAEERERAALQERAEAEADLRLSARARGWLVGTMGVLASGMSLIVGVLERRGVVKLGNEHAIGALALWALLSASAIAYWRRSFLRNAINRQFALLTLMAPVTYAVGHALCLVRGVGLAEAIMYDFLMGAVGFAIIAVLRRGQFSPHTARQPHRSLAAVALLLGCVLIGLFPAYLYELLAAVVLAATLPTAIQWIRPGEGRG
jgi:serine/threonine-protein kinase